MKLVKKFTLALLLSLSTLTANCFKTSASENIAAVGNNNFVLNNWTASPKPGQPNFNGIFNSGGLGVPLVFTQQLNSSDPEQQWNRWKLSNGAYMISNKYNGLCMTVRTAAQGGEISMENCNPNWPAQYFAGGWFNYNPGDIRPWVNQNLCIDMNTFSNNSRVTVSNCWGGSNQNFSHVNDNTGLQWYPGQGPQAVQTRTIYEDHNELFLITRNSGYIYNPTGGDPFGHAWVATVKYYQKVDQRLDGMIWVEINRQYTGVDSTNFHTYSHWPNGNVAHNGSYDNDNDIAATRSIITGNTLPDGSQNFAVRKAWITSDLSNRIFNSIKYNTSCTESYYYPFCPCTFYASNLWTKVTGENIGLPVDPYQAVQTIRNYNRLNGNDFVSPGHLFN